MKYLLTSVTLSWPNESASYYFDTWENDCWNGGIIHTILNNKDIFKTELE